MTSSQSARTTPSARVMVTADGAAGGVCACAGDDKSVSTVSARASNRGSARPRNAFGGVIPPLDSRARDTRAIVRGAFATSNIDLIKRHPRLSKSESRSRRGIRSACSRMRESRVSSRLMRRTELQTIFSIWSKHFISLLNMYATYYKCEILNLCWRLKEFVLHKQRGFHACGEMASMNANI